jgi:uracil phosphoribosyltransferase
MIDKGDIPSIQCTMMLGGPESMRKVDALSLIFIDFYVAALTPRLNSTGCVPVI